MEPNYVGPNGRIDAMAVAWLFANDYVFFNPGEVTWDGSAHGIAGIQVNAAQMDEIPVFVDNVQQLMNGVVDLLLTLESDAGIRVPRSAVHPALHDAIREGDLTALTLFNLQACAHALKFAQSNDSTARDMIKMCGMEAVLDSPAAMDEVYSVLVDERLTRGIPDFYGLVKQMFASMRAYNDIDLPFVLIFVNARNFDADQCFECFDGMVDGAVSEAFHVEAYGQDWKRSDQPEDEGDPFIEGEGGDALDGGAEGDPERALKLSMIRLLVSTAELAGTASFPEELILELERAEAGDMGVDVDDLAERINGCVPDAEAADLSNVTFDGGARADGRRFSVGVPDGWSAVTGYEESTFLGSQVRPFVLVQGEAAADDNLEMRDRVIYSALGGDMEVGEEKAELGTDDLAWAFRFYTTYDRSDDSGLGSLKPVAVWDAEVEAVNTKCFVVQQQVRDEGANGLEFNIFPYANDHTDFLRVVLAYEEGVTDVDHVRKVVMKLASTIELDKPVVCACEKKLREASVGRVTADDFVKMVDGFLKPYVGLRQMIYTSAQFKHVAAGGSIDDKELTIAGAKAIAGFCNRAVPVLERFVSAFEFQKRSEVALSELVQMLKAIEDFGSNVFPTSEIFEGADRALVSKEGVFNPSTELLALRKRIGALKDGELAEEEARRAREARKAEEERRAREAREAEEREAREAQEKKRALEAKERSLTGRSARIMQTVDEWGGSVDLSTMCLEFGLSKWDVESMYSSVRILGDLVIEQVEEHPCEGAGTRCKRFYSWRQVDASGKPKFDAGAYLKRLEREIAEFDTGKSRSELERKIAGYEQALSNCGFFDFSRKEELRGLIAEANASMAALSQRYSPHGETSELKKRAATARRLVR